MPTFLRLRYRLLLAVVLAACALTPAAAHSTGVPFQVSFDPSTVRQTDKAQSFVVATVDLTGPSPTFFVCQLRSLDNRKVAFSPIIFIKGQTEGKTTGVVYWANIFKDISIKVNVFSTDAPEFVISGTVYLKVAEEDQDTSGSP